MTQKPPKRIGDQLIDDGIITPDQLKIALIEQKGSGERIGELLVKLGFVSEEIIREQLSESLGQDSIELESLIPDPKALSFIDQATAHQLRILATSYDESKKKLTIAMADTFDIVTIDRIAGIVGDDIEIEPVMAIDSELETAIDRFYGYELSIDGILQEIEAGDSDTSNLAIENEQYSHPLVRLIDALLADAVKRDASDIHFEPEEKFLRIRYRIDGVLRQIRSLHKKYWPAMVVRLKVISGMNIAETRACQDGRFSLSIGGNPIDFRAAAQPTLHGENVVLRILNRKKGIVPLQGLQLAEKMLTRLKLMMARPEGIILVTGPTGSGKTTTLYSMLNHLNDESVNIMTLEDPVEYPMPQIRQSSVNPSAKLDFADGIRSILRQDPDIIFVGEIRDSETATMAFRAAMTGHQVFSTLHTNSAVGAFPRLLDIGIKPGNIAGNIIGIIAQRLIRKLCNRCKAPYRPEGIENKLLGLRPDQDISLFKAAGCAFCDGYGYKGRTAIVEVLQIDSELNELISNGRSAFEIEQAARKNGFQRLSEDGIKKVLEGVTSLEEITRVIDLSENLGG